MAENKKEESKGGEKKAGAKKKHLHQIIHTFAHDGSASHEHVYKDKKEDAHTRPPQFMGTSQNIEDLQQHDADHAGPAMAQGGQDDEEDDAGGGDPATAASGGAGAPPEPGQ